MYWDTSDITWSSRWDAYLRMPGGKVHWFSILNSLMVVVVMSCIVAMIMMRTIRRDLQRYEQLLVDGGARAGRGVGVFGAGCGAGVLGVRVERAGGACRWGGSLFGWAVLNWKWCWGAEPRPALLLFISSLAAPASGCPRLPPSPSPPACLPAGQGQDVEESGWKMVSGDVFRAPANPLSLCVQVGSGVQILASGFITLLFAALGFLSPASRGSLLTAALVMYLLLSVGAGYAAVWLWGLLNRSYEGWFKVCWRVACFFPGVTVGIMTCLNLFLWATGSSGAIPLGFFFSIIFLW